MKEHPIIFSSERVTAPAAGTVAELRRVLEGLDGEMRVVLSRDAELTECLPVAGCGLCYYSPTAEGAHLTEQPGTIPALVLWPL